MTETNWPDPTRPGVPMFPERDDLHVLCKPKGEIYPYLEKELWFWSALKHCYLRDSYKMVASEAVAIGYSYTGIALTPTQINEMLAAERERIKKMVGRACDLGNLITPRQRDMIVSGVDSEVAIRNLGAAP